jgi:hypothetical protein
MNDSHQAYWNVGAVKKSLMFIQTYLGLFGAVVNFSNGNLIS